MSDGPVERRPSVVLLGPPGAGKGTQAGRMAVAAGLEHVSTGDLFRDHLRNQTDLGSLASDYMTRGDLVPDDIVTAMVAGRIRDRVGYVFDGYPRTIPQAEALDEMIDIPVAVLIEVPEEVLLDRLTGRRVCLSAGHVFHVSSKPPREAGICDFDGSALVQRDDDTVATVKRRLDVYERETSAVVAYYGGSNRLRKVSGMGSPDEVAARLEEVIAVASPHGAGSQAAR